MKIPVPKITNLKSPITDNKFRDAALAQSNCYFRSVICDLLFSEKFHLSSDGCHRRTVRKQGRSLPMDQPRIFTRDTRSQRFNEMRSAIMIWLPITRRLFQVVLTCVLIVVSQLSGNGADRSLENGRPVIRNYLPNEYQAHDSSMVAVQDSRG